MVKRVTELLRLLVLIMLSTSPIFAASTVDDLDSLWMKLHKLYDAGKYEHALTLAKKSLEIAENDERDVAWILYSTGQNYFALGQYEPHNYSCNFEQPSCSTH